MKCTLIAGPQGSGKTTQAEAMAASFDGGQVFRFKHLLTENDFDKFSMQVTERVPSSCGLIIVDDIPGLSILKNWLRLARLKKLTTVFFLGSKTKVAPAIVLVFQTSIPIVQLVRKPWLDHICIMDTKVMS